jgi:hypothetical protein
MSKLVCLEEVKILVARLRNKNKSDKSTIDTCFELDDKISKINQVLTNRRLKMFAEEHSSSQ